jgi:hypothetical protein
MRDEVMEEAMGKKGMGRKRGSTPVSHPHPTGYPSEKKKTIKK